MTVFRKLASRTAIYGIANALTAAVPLLLLPLYARWLAPEDYGLFSLFSTIIVLLVPFISIGASAAVQRRHVEMQPGDFRLYVGAALSVNWLVGLVFSIAGIFLEALDMRLFGLSALWTSAAAMAATAIATQQIRLALWQSTNSLHPYAIYQSACLVLYLFLPPLFLIPLRAGLTGVLAATVLAYSLAGVLAIRALWHDGYRPVFPRRDNLRHLVIFGLPLLPHLLAGWAIAMFDRFLIAHYWGLAAVGAYSFAFQAAQALNLLSASLNQAITPWLYRALQDGTPDQRRAVERVLPLAALGIVLVGVCLAAVFRLLVPWLAPQYVVALAFIDWMVCALVLNGIYRMYSNFMLFRQRTWEIAIGTVLACLTSVTANTLMIPRFGAVAASWTSALSFGVLLVWTVWRARSIRRHAFATTSSHLNNLP